MGNELALITGASSGLGVDFARKLATQGHNVFITARRVERLESLKNEIEQNHNVKVFVFAADLGDPDGAGNILDEIKKQKMTVDVLINCAGYGTRAFILDKTPADWEQMLQVNMNNLVRLTLGVLPDMVNNKSGKILNVASTGAFQATPYFAVYAATKAFVLTFSQGLTKELKDQKTNVKVSCLCPGPTRTEFATVAGADDIAAPGIFWMESEKVVRIGLNALEKNKSICVPGATNKLHAYTVKFMPRSIITKMIGMINRPNNL